MTSKMIPHADALLISHHESEEVDFMICCLDVEGTTFDVQIYSVGIQLHYNCSRAEQYTIEEFIELIAKAGKKQVVDYVLAEREIIMRREGVVHVRN